jgi:chemotaxis signal transduction protein
MLALCFTVDDSIYAIQANCIDEVMPLVQITKTPSKNPALCGFIEYHNSNIPVFDVTLLIAEQPFRQMLSTRIIIVRLSCDTDNSPDERVALVAEKVHETISLEDKDIANIAYKDEKTACVDRIYNCCGKNIQLLKTGNIVPDSYREFIQSGSRGMDRHE